VNTDNTEICIHYWIIGELIGKVASGYCKKCGEVKEFDNTQTYDYGGWVSQAEEQRRQGEVWGRAKEIQEGGSTL